MLYFVMQAYLLPKQVFIGHIVCCCFAQVIFLGCLVDKVDTDFWESSRTYPCCPYLALHISRFAIQSWFLWVFDLHSSQAKRCLVHVG